MKRLNQLVYSRFAQFGIRGMRHASSRGQFDAQGTFGSNRDSVLSWFAVDEKLALVRLLIRSLRAQAIAFFAHKEQKANVNSFVAQTLCRCDLCSNDSFR